jgi:hypothetical protein
METTSIIGATSSAAMEMTFKVPNPSYFVP